MRMISGHFTRHLTFNLSRSPEIRYIVTMPPKAPAEDFPTHSFPTASEFFSFLSKSHATLPGLYLKLAKKTSGIPSLTAAEAVEEALCWGWIDGRANALDSNYWTVRYTPRRAKSIWSQKNVSTVARLIDEGRMQPPGLAAVEAAKMDGRWDRAYAGPANIVEPEDFKKKIGESETAREFWKTLNKSEKYAALWKIETASEKARDGRVEAVVEMLAMGQKPGAVSKAKEKSTREGHAKQKDKVTKKTSKSTSKGQSAKDTSIDEQAQPRRSGLRNRKT